MVKVFVIKGVRCPRCGWVNDPRDTWRDGRCKNLYSCLERARNLTAESITAIDMLEYSERRRALGRARPPRAGADRPVPDEPQGAGEVAVEEDMSKGVYQTTLGSREAYKERGRKILDDWDKGYPISALAARYGVTESRVSQLTTGHTPTASGKTRIMRAIQSIPGLDSNKVSRKCHLGVHETKHLIFSLQKSGLVAFDEKQGNLINIRPTEAGRRWDNGATAPQQSEWVTEQRANIGLPVQEEPEVLAEAAPEPEPFVEPVTPAKTDYPILSRLLRRRNILTAAANLVDNVGESDLAVEIIARIEKPTPLEAEILTLLESLPEVAALVKGQ